MELVFFIVSIASIVVLSFNTVRLSMKYRTSLQTIVKLTINENILTEKLAKSLLENARLSSDDDGFVKFLSDSRDWAYTYIEDVQAEIKKIDSVVTSESKLFDNVKGLKKSDLEGILSRIFASLKDLQKMLPKD
jgi:hypothetical protein